MVTTAPTSQRDRIAVGGSIAVHLCALLVLATLPHAAFPVDDPDERTLLSSIIRIERRPPPLVQPRRALAVTAVARPQPLPVIHTAVTVEHAERRLVVASEQRAASLVVPAVAPRPREARLETTRSVEAHTPGPAAAPVATPAPPAPPAPSPVVAQREDGIGNFGETYPAAIDPSARGALLAGSSGIVVRIGVDENGHATSIEFVRPPTDAALREELRTRLLAAHFVPANCNGLRCAGTLELRN